MTDLLAALGWEPDVDVLRDRLGQVAHRCQCIGLHEGLYASRREFQAFDRDAVQLWKMRDRVDRGEDVVDEAGMLADDVERAIERHWTECTRQSACFMAWHAIAAGAPVRVRTMPRPASML